MRDNKDLGRFPLTRNRAVPGFEGFYEVTEDGRVFSVRRGRELKPYQRNAYLAVNLKANGKRETRSVHRLVCEAFHGPPPTPSHEAAHVDGVRSNNRSTNVKWASRTENEHHKTVHGTDKRGERSIHAKLTNAQAAEIRARVEAGERQTDLARAYSVSLSIINDVVRGRTYGVATLRASIPIARRADDD